MDKFSPKNEQQLQEVIQWAGAEKMPLNIVGARTKQKIGYLSAPCNVLDMRQFSTVSLYEPEELIITMGAGALVEDIEKLLLENNQEFQFEPMNYSHLLNGNEKSGTIGGMIAANLSGPRRIKAGAARDHILGVRMVTGRGDIVKSGGRVVKNVTGYDLSRGLCGSWGTLAALTEVTFKVLPKAENQTTLVICGQDSQAASDAMALAMNSDAEVSAAAYIPEKSLCELGREISNTSQTLLRLEGFEKSVAYRFERLAQKFKDQKIIRVDDVDSAGLWRNIRDVKVFCEDRDLPLWRISLVPTNVPAFLNKLEKAFECDALLDWQGGLIWLQTCHGEHGNIIRKLLQRNGGGHATLIRGSDKMRSNEDVFQPQEPALAALSGRLKNQFDPENILNPGRMSKGAQNAN